MKKNDRIKRKKKGRKEIKKKKNLNSLVFP